MCRCAKATLGLIRKHGFDGQTMTMASVAFGNAPYRTLSLSWTVPISFRV